MSAVYFLGAKEIETKKGDKFIAFILHKDNYQNPCTKSCWLDANSECAELCKDIPIGSAVTCQLDFSGNLVNIEENPVYPNLDLTGFWSNQL